MRYQLFKTSQYLRGWINYFLLLYEERANCYLGVELRAKAHGVALKFRESFNKENQALSNVYLKTEGLYSLRD